MTSPGCRWPSSSSPGPRGLYKNSSQPSAALARMIDNGRRIGTDGSQAMCAKVPGTALRAARGAWTRRTNCCAGPRVLREDACILEKHAAAIALVTHCRSLIARLIHCSAIKHAATGRRCPCRRGGEDTRIGASPRAPTARRPRSASRRRSRPASRSARPTPPRRRAPCAQWFRCRRRSGTPTTSCAGRQSSMMRSMSAQGGSPSARSVVSGEAVRISRFAVAMPMRRSPKSNATRMWRSLPRATRAPPAFRHVRHSG